MLRFLLAPLFLALLAPAANAQKLSSKERAVARRVPGQQAADLALLERVVNINSGTHNLDGVRAVGQAFGDELKRLGFTVRWVPLPDSLQRAGHLIAERKGRKGKGRRLLLLGHLDTVFEPDSPFQKFERQDSLVRGPGVNDMKGAIVMMISALKALQAEGALDGSTITVALMGDEEDTGEPASVARAALVDVAGRSDVVLGFEGSTYTQAVVARRGFTSWRLTAHGKQAHSQGIFRDQNSGAVYEVARILNGFYQEVRGEPNLSFNPGVILGGTEVAFDTVALTGSTAGKLNIIAPEAIAAGDLRYISADQEQRAREAMQKVVEQHLPGTSAEITFYGSSPAMEPKAGNYTLLRELDAVSRELGSGPVEAQDPGTRGAGDISYVAAQADALDGLGTLGGGDHSPDEYMNLKAMPVLTQRAAILIYRLTHRRAGR